MSRNSLFSFIGNEILFQINFAPHVLEYKFIIYTIWKLIGSSFEALSCFHLVRFEVKSSQQEPVGRTGRVPPDTVFHLWRCKRASFHYGINTSVHVKTSFIAPGTNADLKEMSLASLQPPERTCTHQHAGPSFTHGKGANPPRSPPNSFT